MCGIAGATAPRGEAVGRMLEAMAHRGPDDQGLWIGERITLGHRRLSIIDLAGGRQPLANEDGSIRVVFNGEIYNYRELRDELAARGHRLRTQTDTEVLVHLYEDEGPALVRRLYGMFAFALATPDGLFLARDPLGIKPLYVGRDRHGALLFASEIGALLPHVETIEEFPPGHYWTERDGFVRYYELPPVRYDLPSPEAAVDELVARLRRAVRRRLVADVPVGVFLSGGLDSSLIAALVAEARAETGEPVHSFAVGMEGSEDLERARLVAAHLGTVHHEYAFTREELIGLLPEVIRRLESFDAALVRSAVPTYLVSRLARRYVKVVLSGEGADELFGGYQYLKRPEIRARLQDELREITLALHNTNLQRVDRMTMAHGLEGRVPFLSVTLVDLAWRIPPRWKIHDRTGTEKWILRQAARRFLPAAVVQREKAKFAMGTGVGPTLERFAEAAVSDREWAEGRQPWPDLELGSKEELLYFRWFCQAFGPRARLAARLVGRSRSLNPHELYAPGWRERTSRTGTETP
ncbi:asparagine synthase B [Thermaerobacter composti]|uniref:asparagine synthase (glutamine-hydrolyzing) n=1 Tax=Thermaerobacter composti TaxID=554949 RepID=A0ABZ0QQ30_9FIRM|nr:asparagine synthase B [Thermaerobacter composti]WPD19600.1 asparagine synthase B [Thermaerobacter composti]